MIKNDKLTNKSILEVYEMVLNKELNRFPRNFWDKQTATVCFKYVIEDKLKWSREETLENISVNFFYKYKLTSPFKHIWKHKLLNALNDLYKDVNMFEVKGIVRDWSNETIKKEFIIWLIEEKLKWNEEDIKNNFSVHTFDGYSGFLKHGINGNLTYALQLAYPNIQPHEVKNIKLSKEYWEDRKDIMKDIIIKNIEEDNIKLEEIPNKLTIRKALKIFPFSIFGSYFNKNVYELVNFAYPNKFKKEDFNTLWNR